MISRAESAAKDRRILVVLKIWDREYQPTLAHVTRQADIGTRQAVTERLRKLRLRGLVDFDPVRSGGIVLTDAGKEKAETFIDSGIYTEDDYMTTDDDRDETIRTLAVALKGITTMVLDLSDDFEVRTAQGWPPVQFAARALLDVTGERLECIYGDLYTEDDE